MQKNRDITNQTQKKKKTVLSVLVIMGKMCCSEAEDGFDFTGIIIVIVIALLLMALCTTPQRRVVAVYRCY